MATKDSRMVTKDVEMALNKWRMTMVLRMVSNDVRQAIQDERMTLKD